ncbi:cystatin-like protein [Drosophila grimshawi]|uniref:GH14128 n=1 Tax=Drosophila grimshawi TaxID=7222 RepID=B4JXY2_DROGR|nr:cystatin-like protein [Drosophila grimshawi]EDV90544.1 GH14128 [Drosophila grimshawi]
MADQNEVVCGGISQLTGDAFQQALELLETTLETLATGDGPSFRVVKVQSATAQVVAGQLYRYKVQLSQGQAVKDSSVKIWSRPWLKENGISITIQCEGDNNVIERTF